LQALIFIGWANHYVEGAVCDSRCKGKVLYRIVFRCNANLELLRLTNAERKAKGLSPVCVNFKLQATAQAHSEDQAAHSKMTHEGSDGKVGILLSNTYYLLYRMYVAM
jgi:uncharacterized protein YkwD